MLVKELVYSIIDMLKASNSDDAFYAEEHILFLCKKYRSFLIKKEEDKEKQYSDVASDSEYQQICLDLEKVAAIDGEPCTGGYYLRSKQTVPKILEGYTPRLYPTDFYQGAYISYIPRERMRFIGTNKYLQNIIYVSLGPNKHIYLNSSNPQFMYLKQIRMSAVFDDFEEVADYLCDDDCNLESCDVMDMEFPIRDYLVPPLIELVVKELGQGIYRPIDKQNDANDNLPQLAGQSRQ